MGKKEQLKIDGGDIKKDEALSILDDLKESAEDIDVKDDIKQLDMMIDYFTKSWDKIDYTFEEFDVPMGSVPEVYLNMMNEGQERLAFLQLPILSNLLSLLVQHNYF